MQNPKICLICWGVGAGGQERITNGLINYSAEKGYESHLIVFTKKEPFFPLHPSVKLHQPEFEREKMGRMKFTLLLVKFIRKTLKQIRPDTVLSIGEWINPLSVFCGIGLKIPVYVSDRLSPLRPLPISHRITRKLFYPIAKGIIVQTSFASEIIYKRTHHRNIIVIPNPVNQMSRIDCEKKNNIIAVGRLAPEKGQSYLIKAFSKIKNKNWTLTFVGDGPDREKLENLCNDLKIKDKVFFLGNMQKFNKELSESEIFVLPSLSEGFPNALIEAMSVPLPSISFNCIAGPADIINNGINGILVESENIEELAYAIQKMIDDPIKREQIAIEAYKINTELSFAKIADRFINFILSHKKYIELS